MESAVKIVNLSPSNSQEWIRINQLSEKTGLSRHTIHYYLKEQLLPPPWKTGHTMALYTDVHIDCLRLIKSLREKHKMPIAAIRNEVKRRFGRSWNWADSAIAWNGKNGNRSAKGKHQRRRIIETAVELFTQRGYHRTHVGHITDALHLSKGAFYQYFENKDDLFIAVFDHLVSLLTHTEEEMGNEPNFLKRMRKRAQAYFTFYKKYHRIFDIIRAESIGREDKMGMSIDAIYQRMLDALTEDVKRAQEEGRIQRTDIEPELRTLMLFGAYDFICYNIVRGRPCSIEAILDTLDDLFLR
jgi:AcrR family transcriptional regulator/predicted DNA-binding transcriptional regulator AlpA